MLLGNKIEKKRKSLGLTQSQLAHDICTQATISKIESKNEMPIMSILIQVCLRLDLTLNEVVSEFSKSENTTKFTDQFFAKIERNFAIGKITEAKKLIDELKGETEESAYYYYLGHYSLIAKQSADDTRFYLSQAIVVGENEGIYTRMAYNDLGISYDMAEDHQKAKFYFDKSIEKLSLSSSNYLLMVQITRIYTNTARFYSNLEEYQYSNSIISKYLETLHEYVALPSIEGMLYDFAFNLDQMNDQSGAIQENLYSAIAMAKINQNELILNESIKMLDKTK